MKRRLFHLLQDSFMRFFRFVSRVFPDSWVAPAGRAIASLFTLLAVSYRKQILSRLAEAFPEKSPREIRTIFRKAVRNGGEVLFQQLMVNEKMVRNAYRETEGYDGEAGRNFAEMYSRGRGVIAVASHMGNWELLMGTNALHLMKNHGCQVSVVMARMPTPYLDRLVTVLRHKILKCNFIYTKQARHRIRKILEEKGVVAFATDVDYHYKGLFVPFLGRQISMGRGPAYYAIKYHVPLALNMIYRDERGKPHVLCEEVSIPRTGDMDRDVHNLTAELAARVEFWIRTYPEQWFGWLKQPWKTRPLEELEERMRQEPEATRPMEDAGLFYLARGNAAKAEEVFRRALCHDPESVVSRGELGNLLVRTGAREEGLLHLLRALEINPGDLNSLKYLGHYFLRQHLHETALRCFRKAARVRYDDPEVFWAQGRCLEGLGRAREAERAYRRGLRADYDHAPLHAALAGMYASDPAMEKQRNEHLMALEVLNVAPPPGTPDRHPAAPGVPARGESRDIVIPLVWQGMTPREQDRPRDAAESVSVACPAGQRAVAGGALKPRAEERPAAEAADPA